MSTSLPGSVLDTMVNAILLLAISLLGQSLMGEDSEQVITTLYVNNFKQEEQGCS